MDETKIKIEGCEGPHPEFYLEAAKGGISTTQHEVGGPFPARAMTVCWIRRGVVLELRLGAVFYLS